MNKIRATFGLIGLLVGIVAPHVILPQALAQKSKTHWRVPAFKGSVAKQKGKDAFTSFLFEYSGTVVYVDVAFSPAQMKYVKKRIKSTAETADVMKSDSELLAKQFIVRVGERPLPAWYIPLDPQREDESVYQSYINIWLPAKRERLFLDTRTRRLHGHLRLYSAVTWSKGNYFNAIPSTPPK
jgi:hypothetical protein